MLRKCMRLSVRLARTAVRLCIVSCAFSMYACVYVNLCVCVHLSRSLCRCVSAFCSVCHASEVRLARSKPLNKVNLIKQWARAFILPKRKKYQIKFVAIKKYLSATRNECDPIRSQIRSPKPQAPSQRQRRMQMAIKSKLIDCRRSLSHCWLIRLSLSAIRTQIENKYWKKRSIHSGRESERERRAILKTRNLYLYAQLEFSLIIHRSQWM